MRDRRRTITHLTEAFGEFVTQANLAITALGGTPTLTDVVNALNGLLSLTAPFTSLSLNVSSSYRGEDPGVVSSSGNPEQLELLLDIDLNAEINGQTFNIDLGELADNIGINLNVNVSVGAKLEADFSIGLSTGAIPVAFLAPTSISDPADGIRLTVDAAATFSSTPLNLGFLELSLDSGQFRLDGQVEVDFIDIDGTADDRILLSTLPNIGDVTNMQVRDLDPGDGYFFNNAALTIPSGATLGGTDFSAATSVDFGVTFPSDPFGDTSGAVVPGLTLTATVDGIVIDLLNFSNITPNEVLGMLGGVLDTLTGLASSQFMQTAIPYTDVTIGDVLDFGKSFKEDVLDPLFVSGNILEPDADTNGTITFPEDLNFTSIQGLVSEIGDALGVPLTAAYDNLTNELSFTIDFYRAFGLGDGDVATTTPWSSTDHEVQQLTFDTSTVEAFRLTFRDSGGNLIVSDVIDATADDVPISTAIHSFLISLSDFTDVLGFASGDIVVAGSKTTELSQPRAAFDVTFDKKLGNVTQLGFGF